MGELIARILDSAPVAEAYVGTSANHDRMRYARRMPEGKPFGSGATEEGACKKIGSRMKLNEARCRVRRAERFGALLCLEHADQFAKLSV